MQPLSEYYRDLNRLLRIISNGPAKTITFKRLRLLESKFNLHVLLNEQQEASVSKSVPHRDFYNVRKVDTVCRNSFCLLTVTARSPQQRYESEASAQIYQEEDKRGTKCNRLAIYE